MNWLRLGPWRFPSLAVVLPVLLLGLALPEALPKAKPTPTSRARRQPSTRDISVEIAFEGHRYRPTLTPIEPPSPLSVDPVINEVRWLEGGELELLGQRFGAGGEITWDGSEKPAVLLWTDSLVRFRPEWIAPHPAGWWLTLMRSDGRWYSTLVRKPEPPSPAPPPPSVEGPQVVAQRWIPGGDLELSGFRFGTAGVIVWEGQTTISPELWSDALIRFRPPPLSPDPPHWTLTVRRSDGKTADWIVERAH